jgi:AraC-like DNA-binding protein
MIGSPYNGILPVLIMIGAAQGFFLVVALVFMRKGNRRANLFLAAFLLALSILIVDGFMNVTNYYSQYPHMIGTIWPVCYLVGPFFYFYVRELSSSKRVIFSSKQFLHFLIAILSTFFLILFYQIKTGVNAPSLITPLGKIPLPILYVLPLLVGFQKIVYFVLSFQLIRNYSSRIKQSFSSLEMISLSWLRTLLLCFYIFLFLSYVFCLTISDHLGINREASYFFYLGLGVFTYVMAFKALFRPEIFSRIEATHQVELVRTEPIIVPAVTAPESDKSKEHPGTISKEKYQRTWLTDERSAGIARQLLQLMEKMKFYIEPELTLPELADRLGVSPNDLSQVINREMKKNFFDFVNEYRVQEAKRLLSSPKYSHLSILGIALDAGFNSKSAFYTAFGKYAGMKPAEYRNQLERQEVVSSIHE